LQTVARELTEYRLDLLCVQEVIWEKGSTEGAEEYTFFYGKEMENY
jgi:mRNA deadenylase 3'-5' endonuclease subunit Ccr4